MQNLLQKKIDEQQGKKPQATAAELGRLERIYGISPVFMQRAAVITVLAFLFFIAMMIAFYIRQNIGYFLLATAFLIVQLFTLFGWLMARRSEFKIYEKGFSYKKQNWLWQEIESIKGKSESRVTGGAKAHFEIIKKSGEKIVLTEAIYGVNEIIERISTEMEKVVNGKR